jgi:hypothetical protein
MTYALPIKKLDQQTTFYGNRIDKSPAKRQGFPPNIPSPGEKNPIQPNEKKGKFHFCRFSGMVFSDKNQVYYLCHQFNFTL